MTGKRKIRRAHSKGICFGLYPAVILIAVVLSGRCLAFRPEEDPNFYKKLNSRGRILLPCERPAAVIAPTPARPADEKTISRALNESKPWRRFKEKAGNKWSVRWNTATRTPHWATGRPIKLKGPAVLTEDNIESVCRDFLSEHQDLFKTRPGELRLKRSNKAGGRRHILFEQIHNNVPVYGSRVYMGFTKDDRITAFGSDVFADVDVNTVPVVGKNEAVEIAVADCSPDGQPVDRINQPSLFILPMGREAGQKYLLCWKLDILQRESQKRWQYFIDSSNGSIVLKRNILWYANAHGLVKGEYKPEFAGDPVLVEPFPYEEVSAEGPEIPIQFWDFNSDPGWETEGDWAFGQPMGLGSDCGDPTSGYTGYNVYGYNLLGDYIDYVPAMYLTTTPIDCSRYKNVRLRFRRWLGARDGYYDHASIEATNNDVNWVTIWDHNQPPICDGKWVDVAYDLSEVADRQPSVKVRWAMGPTSGVITNPGWNIDDVAIVSVPGETNTTHTRRRGRFNVKLPWWSGSVVSELKGMYCDVDYAGGQDAQFMQRNVWPRTPVNWTWNDQLYSVIDESSVYRHINFIHQYYKTIDRDFNGLDYPVHTRVYENMSNAYWDGEGMAFGRGDGVYFDNFGLYAEVIYHEYCHGVTDKIYFDVEFPYAVESGAMNEGWSDYYACALSVSQSPLIGEGGLIIGEPNGFRTLENEYRRETDWVNEVHADGEMFSSALWEARENTCPEVMNELVHFARYAHATTFEDYLLALLLEDDSQYGDEDLSNGTPHGEAIHTAFGSHGIGGLQYAGPSIVIDDPTGNGNGKLDPGETARLSLTLSNGWADARNISAILTCDDALLTIQKATATFSDADFGQATDNSADPFIVSVAGDCPETHTINFTLTISADGPYRYSRDCLLYYCVAVGQLAYDDGQPENASGYGAPGGIIAVKMTPDTYPCYPTHVRLFPFLKTTTSVGVWGEDVNGEPGTLLGTVEIYPSALYDWLDVDIVPLGLVINSGSIYAGQIEGASFFANGFDNDPPYYQRSWVSYNANWYPQEDFGYLGNFMIRLRFADEPQFYIGPPFEYNLCPGQPVSPCLQAFNGTGPYDWTIIANPPDYNYSIAGSSLFAEQGTGMGWQDDDASFVYDLPFEFTHYGITYSRVYISTNGFLDFKTDAPDYDNSEEYLAYNVRIAPLWDDLTTYAPDDIFIDDSVPGEVTIRWKGKTYQYEQSVNFAVVLFDDGRIRFDYGFNDIGLSATVGISSGDGIHYTLIPGYNGAFKLDNVPSVLFTPASPKPSLPEGITLDQATGCLSGTPLNEGTYHAIIQVSDSSSVPKIRKENFTFTVGYRPADFDSDCIVDFHDFASFSSHWRQWPCYEANGWCDAADLNKSLRVDVRDLAIFAGYWLDGVID